MSNKLLTVKVPRLTLLDSLRDLEYLKRIKEKDLIKIPDMSGLYSCLEESLRERKKNGSRRSSRKA